MSSFDNDVMDDLFNDQAEGPARAYDDFDDESDEFISSIIGGLGRVMGGGNQFDEWDGYDAFDAYDDSVDSADFDALEDAVVDALEAEDTDEFFRRLARGISGIARGVAQGVRRAAPVIGRIARAVGPIASAIPLPWTQAIGRVANIAGRLMADGADEMEALDEMLAFAEDNLDAAAPVIAGLTIRRTMRGASSLPRQTRANLVRSVTRATQTLARRQGPQAARAVPAVVRTVQNAVRQQRIPARAVPQVIQRAATRVASNPTTVRRMAAQVPLARVTSARRASRRPIRHYNLRPPFTITVR